MKHQKNKSMPFINQLLNNGSYRKLQPILFTKRVSIQKNEKKYQRNQQSNGLISVKKAFNKSHHIQDIQNGNIRRKSNDFVSTQNSSIFRSLSIKGHNSVDEQYIDYLYIDDLKFETKKQEEKSIFKVVTLKEVKQQEYSIKKLINKIFSNEEGKIKENKKYLPRMTNISQENFNETFKKFQKNNKNFEKSQIEETKIKTAGHVQSISEQFKSLQHSYHCLRHESIKHLIYKNSSYFQPDEKTIKAENFKVS